MPVYEFVCPECHMEMTKKWTIQEYSELDKVGIPIPCPTCDALMRRRWSPPGVEIK